MDKTRFRLSAAAATILALLAAFPARMGVALAQQDGSTPDNQEGILLLRNGETLRGKIATAGDRFRVSLSGGEVTVRSTDVELACRTLDEAYQQKRARIRSDNVAERLDLAQWCQRQGLLGAAAQELSEAMAIDPSHPMISVVECRLRLALDQPPKMDRPTGQKERVPTSEELDRLVRGMPPGTVEAFTQTIQPLLMNNCAASGCHGPGWDRGLSLLRAPTGRPASRRLTQRNLLATLQWIDRSDPARSSLLTAPTRPHGNARAPIFTDQQVSQYQELVDWVYRVSRVPSPVSPTRHREATRRPSHVTPAGYDDPLPPASEKAPPFPGLTPPSAPRQLGPKEGIGAPGGPSRTPGRSAATRPGLPRAQPIPSSVPADELDPEVFNRRYAPPPRPPAANGPPSND